MKIHFRRSLFGFCCLLLILSAARAESALMEEPPQKSGFGGMIERFWNDEKTQETVGRINEEWTKFKMRMRPHWEKFASAWSQVFSGASEQIGGVWQKFEKTKAGAAVSKGVEKAAGRAKDVAERFDFATTPIKKNEAVIYLKNGSALSCLIKSEDDRQVVVEWQGGEVTFKRSEIATIERQRRITENKGVFVPEAEKAKWPYANSPVVRLKNGQTIDAQVIDVKGSTVVLAEDMGGGARIERDIERDQIEFLEFMPLNDPESAGIEDRLKGLFPKMNVFHDGIATIFTDSRGSSLKALRNSVQQQFTANYLEFHELFRGRKPQRQHFVVVFDDLLDYFQYAVTDGIPPLMCPGYFSPKDKTLFMMNYFGDQFSEFLYSVISVVREVMNKSSDSIKGQVDDRYHAQIDGAVQDAKVKIENMMAYLKNIFMEQTLVTLRHEVTHEFFHNWGVQSIIVSKVKGENLKVLEKRKELLKTEDVEKKKELIIEILKVRGKEAKKEKFEADAANSWFIEGLAEYASTSAVGRRNDDRLFVLKEARAKNELLPIEHLTVYKMGSFLSVADDAVVRTYAQSWSFVEFLMRRHRAGFIQYLDRMAREKAQGPEDIRWLLQATGTDLRGLENEWYAYIDTLETVPDPQIEQWFRVREILDVK